MDRRDFLKSLALAGLGTTLLAGCRSDGPGSGSAAAQAGGKVGNNRLVPGPVNGVHIAVARNKAPAELVAAALAAFGGMSAFVKPGDRVVIKPNIAWSRTPEQAACTSPEVLTAVIKACQEAQAAEVLVADHTCDTSSITFDLSGLAAACKDADVPLVDWGNEQQYREVELARGQNLKTDRVPLDLLDCDAYINLPTLKHHAATAVTLALKNQMGCVWDRGRYHSTQGAAGGNNLHRNIADLATALRPTLNILDATRALKTNGPKGPGLVEELNAVCISPDIVALDAYGARLLGHDPASIPHIKMAAADQIGKMQPDASLIRVV
ncbi:MAG: DUF362 domain-containing protein [Armatimonadia bacterium]